MTNFQDLVAKVKNLVTLVPVLGAISRPAIGKDYQKVADSKVYVCSDTDLGKVLFHYVMFCNKENRDLLRKIYRISFNEIS